MTSGFVDRVIPELWSRSLRQPKTQTDVVFKCEDGTIPAHKLLLKPFCLTLDECIQRESSEQDDLTTVILPETSVRLVAKFLRLIYTGTTFVANKTEMEEIGSFAANVFGFASDFGSAVTLNPIPDDRTKECDNYSIEDCSVAPPIAIYFGEEDESDADNWPNEGNGSSAKRPKLDGPSSESPVRCPECDETFMTIVKLHTHAVNAHYYSQLKTLLQPQFKESKGFCLECQRGSASLQSFMYHMGVKHRLVFAVMTKSVAQRYLSLVPDDISAEDDESSAVAVVASSTHEPSSNQMSIVEQATEEFFVCQDDESYPMPPLGGGTSFIQCPECSLILESAKSLYSHAIDVHYYNPMARRLEPEFRRLRGLCIFCKLKADSLDAFIHHLGLEHRLLHQYLPANLVPVFSNLLSTELGGSVKVRQRNPRNSKGTIPCQEPDCEKTFDSISALYFHAAAIHYKKPLQEMYGEEFKRVKGICTVCGSRLNSKQYYYIHMGSRHRVIQQLMDTETLIKYQSIGK